LNPLLSFPQWHSEYKRIASLLNIDEEKDREATLLLSHLLSGRKPPLDEAQKRISGRHVFVYGTGPSLETSKVGTPSIAADGATSYLLEKGKTPEIIVTDLDGRIGDLRKADSCGSILFIHAHGDNMERIRRHVPRFKNVVGTTQSEPRRNVYNFGGFTDGDRALFLAKAFGASRVTCLGFDFGDVVGRYSKPYLRKDRNASPIKQKKLEITHYLIEKYELCDSNL